MTSALLLATIAAVLLGGWACDTSQYMNGCKISGGVCKCSYGCRSEYVYSTRRACYNALRDERRHPTPAAYPPPQPQQVESEAPERGWNICYRMPCVRGICIQTTNEAGFTCKCEGTGFYGLRCDKACPTHPVSGMVFPHECVII